MFDAMPPMNVADSRVTTGSEEKIQEGNHGVHHVDRTLFGPPAARHSSWNKASERLRRRLDDRGSRSARVVKGQGCSRIPSDRRRPGNLFLHFPVAFDAASRSWSTFAARDALRKPPPGQQADRPTGRAAVPWGETNFEERADDVCCDGQPISSSAT
ncbi:hypothetical protein MTO96_014324 [Rhipicephalus appendiculatus]